MQTSDWISLGSAAITLIGFIVTLYQLSKTKGAAESASQAARTTSEQINGILTISNLSKYTQITRLILSNISDGKFLNAAEKLIDVREMLIEIKENPEVSKHADIDTLNGFLNDLPTFMYNLRQKDKDDTVIIDIETLDQKITAIHTLFKEVEVKIKHSNSYARKE